MAYKVKVKARVGKNKIKGEEIFATKREAKSVANAEREHILDVKNQAPNGKRLRTSVRVEKIK
jgi:hypothetical protein